MKVITYDRDEFNKLNKISKLRGKELRKFILDNDLNSINEYIVTLNTVLLSGEGREVYNGMLSKLPTGYSIADVCPVCGFMHVMHESEEKHCRSLCPVCGLTTDQYLDDYSYVYENLHRLTLAYYLNDSHDEILDILKRIKKDLDDGYKVLECIPFDQDVCLHGIPKDVYDEVSFLKAPVMHFIQWLDSLRLRISDKEVLELIEKIWTEMHEYELMYVTPYIVDKVDIILAQEECEKTSKISF